jgi:hypothetical protein
MAISPNTDFSSGAVLTAAQQNRFPRGVMAYAQTTTSDATITVEEIEVTSTSFTAVANRYYKITYYEPQVGVPAIAGAFMVGRIRLTNLAGTGLQSAIVQNAPATALNYTMNCVWTGTLSAGSTTIVASLICSSGTGSATRATASPSSVAFILVEDIGPA